MALTLLGVPAGEADQLIYSAAQVECAGEAGVLPAFADHMAPGMREDKLMLHALQWGYYTSLPEILYQHQQWAWASYTW